MIWGSLTIAKLKKRHRLTAFPTTLVNNDVREAICELSLSKALFNSLPFSEVISDQLEFMARLENVNLRFSSFDTKILAIEYSIIAFDRATKINEIPRSETFVLNLLDSSITKRLAKQYIALISANKFIDAVKMWM